MFRHNHVLKSLDLHKWDTSKVTNMNQMFNYCTSLEDLNISTWDFSSIEDTAHMFNVDAKIKTEFTLNANPEKYTAFGGTFNWAATAEGAGIVVNYTSSMADKIDEVIATKSNSSKVVKGVLKD